MFESDWRLLRLCDEYAVHKDGTIKRVKSDRSNRYLGRVLMPSINSGGYPQVTIVDGVKRHSQKVANLVCAAFHGERPSPIHQVAHNDGDKLNSHADNVRWATPTENAHDKHLHGTILKGALHPLNVNPHLRARGTGHGNAKLTDNDVREIKRLRSLGYKQVPLAAMFGVSQSSLWAILSGKTWSHVA